jgi:hypothetical protein
MKRENVIFMMTVVARSKAWACGRSLARIAGSHATGGIDICPL